VADTPAHDPGRFARAFKLAMSGRVQQIGPRQYRVAGNEQPYYDVDLDGDQPCYCEDQDWSGRKIRNNCKHVLAARIVAQDPSVIPSLMELAYSLEKRKAS
jgi:hypothetical protein